MTDKRKIGTDYETLAARLLELEGYSVLERNYRVKSGEIDIIAKNEGYLCFVEVKARKNTRSGFPEEAITPYKMNKIRHTALFYMFQRGLPENTPVRFDLCLVLGGRYKIVKNAFDFR